MLYARIGRLDESIATGFQLQATAPPGDRLFDYTGEPHGLRKRPNQKDYTIRLQQYFDHYLKGAPAPAWMEKGVPYIERERTELSTMGGRK